MHNKFNGCFSPPRSIVRSPSKQEFFAVKRRRRRLSSLKHSDPQPLALPCNPPPEHRIIEDKKPLLPGNKCKQKELVSTFGSDNFLNFRSKPPKRKRKRACLFNQFQISNVAEESESQSEGSLWECKDSAVTQKPISKQKAVEREAKRQWGIGDFVLLQKIGEGMYSEVHRAKQKQSGFICSLKILNKYKMRRLKVEDNLLRQIKINLFMDHPHIVALYGCFSDQHSVYLITELASDHNLYEAISQARNQRGLRVRDQEPRGLPSDAVKGYAWQLCIALKYLHQNMILHRDIKPENMLITFSSTLKVCDFGWSIHNPDKSLRSTLCGTPIYLAPELIKQETYSESVDLWALGIVTFEMITGQLPFRIRSIRDLSKVVTQDVSYAKVKDPLAVDFISSLLRKEQGERKNIEDMSRHPFLDHFRP